MSLLPVKQHASWMVGKKRQEYWLEHECWFPRNFIGFYSIVMCCPDEDPTFLVTVKKLKVSKASFFFNIAQYLQPCHASKLVEDVLSFCLYWTSKMRYLVKCNEVWYRYYETLRLFFSGESTVHVKDRMRIWTVIFNYHLYVVMLTCEQTLLQDFERNILL